MMANPVITENFTLEDWMRNPPDCMEWVDGKLVEKNPVNWGDGQRVETIGITLKHNCIQARLARYWESYMASSGQKTKWRSLY